MRTSLAVALLACLCARADAATLYQQPPDPSGASHVSAWWEPDGSNYDRYVWDAFTLASSADIYTVGWRGTFGASGPATNFTVAIYASIAAGTQPDFSQPPLVEYQTGDDAGQTYAGVFGGVTMYDHGYTLPVAFHAQAGVKYWLQVEGWQGGMPDWSLAAGTGGDGSHFLCEHTNVTGDLGVPTGCWFTSRTGDAAFILKGGPPVGVEDAPRPAVLSLQALAPNPSRGERLDVAFTLPDAAPARVALVDLAGRRVAAVDVGTWGAGLHHVNLAGSSPLPPGIYFVRLTRGDRDFVTRAAIVR